MRAIIFALGMGLSSVSHAQGLACRSYEKVDGWKAVDTYDFVYFKAEAMGPFELRNAVVEGAYASDQRSLKKDLKFRPRLEKYTSYDRYQPVEDAWCWFSPVLPKQLDQLQSGARFTGFLHVLCEGGRKKSISMGCRVN